MLAEMMCGEAEGAVVPVWGGEICSPSGMAKPAVDYRHGEDPQLVSVMPLRSAGHYYRFASFLCRFRGGGYAFERRVRDAGGECREGRGCRSSAMRWRWRCRDSISWGKASMPELAMADGGTVTAGVAGSIRAILGRSSSLRMLALNRFSGKADDSVTQWHRRQCRR